jgi:hypothetical protein
MGVPTWKSLLTATAACAVLLTPIASDAQGRGREAKAAPPGQSGRQQAVAPSGPHGTPVLMQRPRPQQESAFAAGYQDGREKGAADGRDGERYDPVRHREYRDAERGYSENYGSRDAYRDNYRAGFRQGYEEGYRDGTGNRRRR